MTDSATQSKGNKPVHSVRIGRITGAIWANESDKGTFHNVTFGRLYKNDAGKWQDAESFGREDLHLVGKVADQCEDWIYQNGKVAQDAE